jgi:hypothetical protein
MHDGTKSKRLFSTMAKMAAPREKASPKKGRQDGGSHTAAARNKPSEFWRKI